VEELELIAPADLLRRAGAKVWFVSTESTDIVTTRGGFGIQTHLPLENLDGAEIDLLVLPGGPGVVALRQHEALRELQNHASSGKPLAAICAAPLLLQDAGLLQGKAFTCHFSCREELPAADQTRKVVVDGDLITSQGAGTSVDFGLALVEKLYGADAREDIACAILA
jgi:4-methyl-5(b-hydroxyethyl)-thiazole monophosphate biosynthesis